MSCSKSFDSSLQGQEQSAIVSLCFPCLHKCFPMQAWPRWPLSILGARQRVVDRHGMRGWGWPLVRRLRRLRTNSRVSKTEWRYSWGIYLTLRSCKWYKSAKREVKAPAADQDALTPSSIFSHLPCQLRSVTGWAFSPQLIAIKTTRSIVFLPSCHSQNAILICMPGSSKSRGMSIFVAREGWQTSTLTPSLASVSQAGRIRATFYRLRNWPGGQEQSGGGGESVRNLRNGEKTISVHSGHLPSLVIQLVTPTGWNLSIESLSDL